MTGSGGEREGWKDIAQTMTNLEGFERDRLRHGGLEISGMIST